MSAISVLTRRLLLSALTAAGIAAITAAPMLATPGAALAATARPQAASVAATAKYESYPITFHNRIITLWFNESTFDWHAEISDAAPGDRIQLQYNHYFADPGSSTVGVSNDENYANTPDFYFPDQENYRACGYVVNVPAPKCTGWVYDPYS
jgi:hypothetical protein